MGRTSDEYSVEKSGKTGRKTGFMDWITTVMVRSRTSNAGFPLFQKVRAISKLQSRALFWFATFSTFRKFVGSRVVSMIALVILLGIWCHHELFGRGWSLSKFSVRIYLGSVLLWDPELSVKMWKHVPVLLVADVIKKKRWFGGVIDFSKSSTVPDSLTTIHFHLLHVFLNALCSLMKFFPVPGRISEFCKF